MAKKQDNTKQRELIMVMVIALILGAAGGYVIGANSESTNSDTSSSEMAAAPAHSHGSMYMVSAEEAPKVELVVSEDAKSGYNVKVIATDFTFTPEGVNGDNVLGEGHAHLYVDGEKVGRLYSPYFHYDGSFEGTKTFRVTLNANDHSEYAVDGEVIEAEVPVTHDSDAADHDDAHMTSDKKEDTDHTDGDDHSRSM